MSMATFKREITKRRKQARLKAYEACKGNEKMYDSGTATWWTAKWHTYTYVLSLLDKHKPD